MLEGRCVISVHHELDENLRTVIQTSDHEKFRQELWYSRDELDTRIRRKGFLCLLASLDGRAVAFDYGYEDEEEGGERSVSLSHRALPLIELLRSAAENDAPVMWTN